MHDRRDRFARARRRVIVRCRRSPADGPHRSDRDPRRRRGCVRSRRCGKPASSTCCPTSARRCSSRGTGSSATSTRRPSCRRRRLGRLLRRVGRRRHRQRPHLPRRDAATSSRSATAGRSSSTAAFQHVCNVSADRRPDGALAMACTTYPDAKGLEQAGVLPSDDGERWNGSPAPYAATRDGSHHDRRLPGVRRRRHQRHERPAARGRQVPAVLQQFPRRREDVPRERATTASARVRRRRPRRRARSSTT